MIRRKSKFSDSYWWGCPNYPKCTITTTEHPDGRVMGTPADRELKALRIKAHRLAEAIWGKWDDKDKEGKQAMYSWLTKNSHSGHIGHMRALELELVIDKLETLLEVGPEKEKDESGADEGDACNVDDAGDRS